MRLPSKKPPVPLILRPSTSISLRGRYRAGTPSFCRPERGGLADAPGYFGKIRHTQACAIEHQFPADLSLVEVETAAAGDPPHGLDAVRLAVIELDLVAEELMDSDQRGGAKAQKANCVGNLAFSACLDQRLIEGDIGAAAAQSGCDDAKRLARRLGHVRALRPSSIGAARARSRAAHAGIDLPARLADVVAVQLERIGGDVARRRIAVGPVASGNIVGFLARAAGGAEGRAGFDHGVDLILRQAEVGERAVSHRSAFVRGDGRDNR